MIQFIGSLTLNINRLEIILMIAIAILVIFCLHLLKKRFYLHIISLYLGLPLPKYRTLLQPNIKVPMLDGTALATDIYRPDARGKFPVILIRTPYSKQGTVHPYKQFAEIFASQGYVVVVQDVRGKYESEGTFLPYFNEALDGHSTINWAGNSHWSNGNVALMGLSYLGSCAWLAAQIRNPYLKTIIPMFTTQDTYSIWVGSGMPFLKGPLYWLSVFGEKKENAEVTHLKIEPILWQLPVNELDVFAVNHQIPFYQEYLKHLVPDQFWEMISVNHQVDQFDIPALIIGGWYDPFIKGTFEDYQRMMQSTSLKNTYSELYVGPWSHNPAQKFKNISFGNKGHFSHLLITTLNWCNNWLKQNIPNIDNKGRIQYFLMGKNKWKEALEWPPKNVIEEKYFLTTEETKKVSRYAELSKTLPSQEYSHQYMYNPRDPVLFRGSYLLYDEGWIVPIQQNEIIAREDVLIYTSSPMQEELMVVGSVKLILYVSSDALDTDFCAKLCDVHPNGKSINLASGFIRMRYRESLREPKLMEKDKIYRIEIPFKPVANAFLKKHRIQLQITSSDFPVHNRNLNTGMSCEYSIHINEAKQTVYFGGIYDSHLLLPILGK